MKILIVLRHGKSSWSDPGLTDRDRPLKPKGERRTRKVAEYIRDHWNLPLDRIVTSPVVRAAQTARIVADILGVPESHLITDERLYDAEPFDCLDVFCGMDDHWNAVMVVGHNPSLTCLVNRFLPEPLDNLPTSGCVGLRFDVRNWADIAEATSEVLFVLIPKQLELNCD